MRRVLGGCVLVFLFSGSIYADTLSYEWIAQVSSAGTCQPYCGPYGFDVQDRDWITGTLIITATGPQSAIGAMSAVIGSTTISGGANFRIVELNGSTPMALMSGPDGSYAYLHPTFGQGCGIYGCTEFPTHFDEIVFEVRTNHGPDLDPLDYGPPQARYLNAWCPVARCFTELGTMAAVPEPGSWLLLATGLLGIGVWRYRGKARCL